MTSRNSRKHSNQKTMDYPSRYSVAPPFYSIGMKCYKIEFTEMYPPKDFRHQKESCICCENKEDADIVYRVVKSFTTWEQWISCEKVLRSALLKGSGNRVWRVGARGISCELFHTEQVPL